MKLSLPKRSRPGLALGVAGVASGVIAVLALRPSPYLTELAWMPEELARWADAHGRLRNLPAFFLLCLALLPALGLRLGGAVALALGLGLEAAQLFIPGRYFDPLDLLWSALGVAAACFAVVVGRALLFRCSPARAEKAPGLTPPPRSET
jgi:hypothetical protein